MKKQKADSANPSQSPKKPIFKRWWFWAIIVVVAVAAIGGSGSDKDSTADSTPSAAVTATPEPTPAPPTEEPSAEPTDIVSDAPESSDSLTDNPSSFDLDTLCALINSTLVDSYSGCDVTHTDETITVNLWLDGLAMEVVLAQESDSDAYMENWETAKANTVTLAGSICDLIDTAGREDVYLNLNILNDINLENVLLSIYETVVIYDVMA